MVQNLTKSSENVILDQYEYLNDLSEAMNDPDLTEAMEMIIRVMRKPDVPPAEAVDTIVKMQAISAKLGMGLAFYKTFGQTGTKTMTKQESGYRKNVYYSARKALDDLVDALKYIVRAHERGVGR